VTGAESYWVASTDDPGYPALDGELATQVAIVGAGIAGLTTALLLARAGVEVAVVEARTVGSGVTGHTTGKLTALQGLAYVRIESAHGEEAARRYAASQTAALELVFGLADELAVPCELERATDWVYALGRDEVDAVARAAAAARRAGLPVTLVRPLDAPFPAAAGLCLEGQGQLHARRYVLGLARELIRLGAPVHQGTRVLELEDAGGGRTLLHASGGTIRARHVVLATNAAITDDGLLFARAHPRRAYAVAAPVPEGAVEGMWINAGAPTRSLRTAPLEPGKRLLLLVGEGHRVGQSDDPGARYDALRSDLARWFPGAEPTYRWSTQDQYSVDSLPFVGRVGGAASRTYVATGFGGWGLTNGTLAGMVLSDAILGRGNEWGDLLDPERRSLVRAPARLARENANVAFRLLEGKLRSRPESPDDVPQGGGRVLDVDGRKVAVHRTEDGELHAVSAACTHMGCLLEWNAAERSWDCPCHGSRFDVTGDVLDGPATRPLEPVPLELPAARRR